MNEREAKTLVECQTCGRMEESRYIFACPDCEREGCPECMPAGRNCPCPECEEKEEGQDP